MGAVWQDGVSGTQLNAFACPANYYGIAGERQYGLRLTWCVACPVNQVTSGDTSRNTVDFAGTPGVGYFSRSGCVNAAGYGWVPLAWSTESGTVYNGTASEACLLDTFSTGGSNGSCTACSPGTYTSTRGSTSCDLVSLSAGRRAVAAQSNAASGAGLSLSIDTGVTWAASPSTSGAWLSVGSSATGRYLAAVRGSSDTSACKIFTSDNHGRTWVARGDVAWADLKAAAVSSSGQYMVAVGTDNIYTSVNYGATWVAQNKAGAWAAVTIASTSGDRILVAQGGDGGRLMLGLRTGSAWGWAYVSNAVLTAANGYWSAVASKADGSAFYAAQSGTNGLVYAGAYGGGSTWTWELANDATLNASTTGWAALGASSDGRLLAAAAGTGGSLYTGAFASGWGWTQVGGLPAAAPGWAAVAVSQDFSVHLAANAGTSGLLYRSTTSGSSYAVVAGAGTGDWRAVALSQ